MDQSPRDSGDIASTYKQICSAMRVSDLNLFSFEETID
jgi:hypothetical protein